MNRLRKSCVCECWCMCVYGVCGCGRVKRRLGSSKTVNTCHTMKSMSLMILLMRHIKYRIVSRQIQEEECKMQSERVEVQEVYRLFQIGLIVLGFGCLSEKSDARLSCIDFSLCGRVGKGF